jgi:hypothetical protein
MGAIVMNRNYFFLFIVDLLASTGSRRNLQYNRRFRYKPAAYQFKCFGYSLSHLFSFIYNYLEERIA